jgi:2-oxoglutarate ferredoxin oxidoreductase subunit gamma
MDYSVVMAGFGGQGVLMMGDLLAYSAMKAGLHVTWMPAYGVEMRGGAANCTVVLSDEAIGAPIVGVPHAVIAMSEPGLHKFKGRLPSKGLLMVNSSLLNNPVEQEDGELEAIYIPARELAEASGNGKMENLAMLGAFLAHTGLLDLEQVMEQVPDFLPAAKRSLAPGINRALLKGKEFMEMR